MSNEVYANGMEISCKAAAGKSVAAFPDVCMTPPECPATPPGVPIPYPNTGMASDCTEGSKSVEISGQEIMLKDKSYFKKSTGDEAGSAAKKGVVTSCITGKVYFTAWSMDVKVEQENVARNLDLMTHNHASVPGNTGPWPYMDKAAMDNPTNACAADEENRKAACKDVADPCAGLGSKKPSGAKVSSEADSLADKTAANDCLAASRCALKPYSPNKCCKPQTPHHIVEASALFDVGRGGEGSNPLKGIKNYNENKAPCVCAEGKNQFTGTHGLMHTFQSAAASKCTEAPLALANGGSVDFKATTYGDAKANGISAFKKVFPQSKCSEPCLAAQLDSYHSQCGIDDSTPVKAVETGDTDVSAAEKAIEDRTLRISDMKMAAGNF